MNDELKIKFWGVRGSYPTPGAGTVKYGGNTACVEICAGGRTIILDAGTGIIPLGRELAKTKTSAGIAAALQSLASRPHAGLSILCASLYSKYTSAHFWSRRHA